MIIIRDMVLGQLITQAWQVRRMNFPDEIQFCKPHKTMAISVTGTKCELTCAHCGGYYLKHMTPVEQWEGSKRSQNTSVLISGGCDRNGTVPVLRSLPVLKKISQAGVKINLHSGLIDKGEIEQISQIVDTVSFDFVGDNETIREVYGLARDVEEFVDVYRELRKKVRVIPHICIGLRGGHLSGEFKAIDRLRDLGVEGLVFLVFRPTRGTCYGDRLPPSPEDVARVLCKARVDLPRVPLFLGCMRPGGKHRLEVDRLALKCGVNKIVQPAPGTEETALNLGLEITSGEECCVL